MPTARVGHSNMVTSHRGRSARRSPYRLSAGSGSLHSLVRRLRSCSHPCRPELDRTGRRSESIEVRPTNPVDLAEQPHIAKHSSSHCKMSPGSAACSPNDGTCLITSIGVAAARRRSISTTQLRVPREVDRLARCWISDSMSTGELEADGPDGRRARSRCLARRPPWTTR